MCGGSFFKVLRSNGVVGLGGGGVVTERGVVRDYGLSLPWCSGVLLVVRFLAAGQKGADGGASLFCVLVRVLRLHELALRNGLSLKRHVSSKELIEQVKQTRLLVAEVGLKQSSSKTPGSYMFGVMALEPSK